MSPRRKISHQFDVVVNLAIEDDTDCAVLVENRLVAAGQIDDAEAAVSESDVAAHEESLTVRTAVAERGRHPAQQVLIDPRGTIGQTDSCDSTHRAARVDEHLLRRMT